MKLSELTYEYLQSVGLGETHMHTDQSDEIRLIHNQYSFDHAKKELLDRYGDVELEITPGADWYEQIVIKDEKWREDNEKYVEAKQRACSEWGCN